MSDQRFRDLGDADAYELLGVPEDAAAEDIRRAHRERVQHAHPDRRNGADPGEWTRRLNIARDVLLKQRAAYDEYRRGGRQEATAAPNRPEPAMDPWSGTASGPPPARPRPAAHPPAPRPPFPPPPYPPHFHPPRRPAPRKRSFWPVWTALITAGMISIGGLTIFLSIEPDSPDSHKERPSAEIPKRYAGTWTGKVKFGPGTSKVRIVLPRGRKEGKSTYGTRCTEKLVPIRTQGGSLTLHEVAGAESADCVDAWITVVPADHHRLRLTYASTMDGTRDVTATITRKER